MNSVVLRAAAADARRGETITALRICSVKQGSGFYLREDKGIPAPLVQ